MIFDSYGLPVALGGTAAHGYSYWDALGATRGAPSHEVILKDLLAERKRVSPKWFYDAAGSDLFERITALPEYYLTRCEEEILSSHAAEIIALTGCSCLVELGSGSANRTRYLLDEMSVRSPEMLYCAIDISEPALRLSSRELAELYPAAGIMAVRADFTAELPLARSDEGRLLAILGGSAGNFSNTERMRFFTDLRARLGPRDHFLFTTDLVKAADKILPAYNDSAGLTAEFNRNILHVLNRELGANFQVEEFGHVAVWVEEEEWIEMRLRSEIDQEVVLAAAQKVISFRRGEELLTEVSNKLRLTTVLEELTGAGFTPVRWWTDAGDRYSASLWATA